MAHNRDAIVYMLIKPLGLKIPARLRLAWSVVCLAAHPLLHLHGPLRLTPRINLSLRVYFLLLPSPRSSSLDRHTTAERYTL